jgi:outer membrane protein assembly factor BamB
MFHHDPLHTGRRQFDSSANDGFQKWMFFPAAYVALYSSPAIGADGTIYVGGDFESTDLYAVNPNGTQKWAFITGGGVDSSPAIAADGTIYAGSNDGNLYAVNPDGTEKWAFATGGTVNSSPAVGADGTICVLSASNSPGNALNLYAVNADGTAKWSAPFVAGSLNDGSGDTISSPAIGSDGTIYIGSFDGNLYAVNPDGTEKWAFPTGGSVASSPAIGSDGTIYVNGPTLCAVNADGTQEWCSDYGGGSSSPAIAANGTVYVGSDDGNLYATNPDGSEEWAFGTGINVNSSPGIGADGTIYVQTGYSQVHLRAIYPNGTEKWDFGGGVGGGYRFAAPAIGTDGTIYISSGGLFAVGGATPTSISVPASLTFPNTLLGKTSTKNLTVKNTGENPLFITGMFFNDSAEFGSTGATTCPSTGLAPGLTCTVTLSFTPNTPGARGGSSLSISDNTATSPQSVALSGSGTTDVTTTPTKVSIGNVKWGVTVTESVTVTNHMGISISLNSESFSGPNAADFSAAGGGTCGTTLAAMTSCSQKFSFTPGALGTESATLVISDSPDLASPHNIAVDVAGTIPETVAPMTLSYGTVSQTSSKTLKTTVTNKSSFTISIGTAVSGANGADFTITGGTCGPSLAGNSSCTISVEFKPTTAGPETASLSVSVAEDPTGPHTVNLKGTGL